jgi:hypothetical protein
MPENRRALLATENSSAPLSRPNPVHSSPNRTSSPRPTIPESPDGLSLANNMDDSTARGRQGLYSLILQTQSRYNNMPSHQASLGLRHRGSHSVSRFEGTNRRQFPPECFSWLYMNFLNNRSAAARTERYHTDPSNRCDYIIYQSFLLWQT